MDFGIHIGTRGCLASRDNMMAVAQRAEALGYAYLGVADHLIVPVQTDVRYPYTADGLLAGRADRANASTAIATLAFLAGCTQRHQAADLGRWWCRIGRRCWRRNCS